MWSHQHLSVKCCGPKSSLIRLFPIPFPAPGLHHARTGALVPSVGCQNLSHSELLNQEMGVANLATYSDYNHLANGVNANRLLLVSLSGSHLSTSWDKPKIVM